MPAAPVPRGESERLNCLRSLSILDTPNEETFDRIVGIVRSVFGVPAATISFVDEHRQWFKARAGLDACETERSHAFCAHAILSDEPLIVPDAARDSRFADNPLVNHHPGIRFYAGAPLVTSDGHRLGALCAIDFRPRNLDKEQTAVLCALAKTVTDLVEARMIYRAAQVRKAELQLAEDRFRMLSKATKDVIWDLDLQSGEVWWNENLHDSFGYQLDHVETTVKWWADRIHPQERDRVVQSLHARIDDGSAHWAEKYQFLHADGHYVPVYDRAHIIRDANGHAIRALGAMFDQTESRRVEQLLRDHNLVIEHSNVVIVRWSPDPGWPIELVSENIAQFGYSALDLLEKRPSYAAIVHPDDVERVAREENGYVAAGIDQFEQEYRIVRRDGQIRWVYDRTLAERDEHGNIVAWNGVVLDISDRKKAEEQAQSALRDLHDRIKETRTLTRILRLMHDNSQEMDRTLQDVVTALPDGFQNPARTRARLILGDREWTTPEFAESPNCLASSFSCKCGWSGRLEVFLCEATELESSAPFHPEEAQLLQMVVESIESYLDRRRIEEELRKHKIVVENSDTVLFRWRLAPGWPVDTVSDNVIQFGYSASDLLTGRVSFETLVHPDDRERVEREVLHSYESGIDSIVQEYRILCRNGAVRWVYDRTTAERDASGEVTHFQGIVIDATERRLAEEARRETEERLRRIASQVPGAVYQFRLDAEGNQSFAFISEGVRELSGFTPHEIYADPTLLNRRVLPEDRTQYQRSITQSARTLQPWQQEFRIIHADGSLRWISGNSSPRAEEDGSVVWHGLITDVTERKEAEERARAVEVERNRAEAASQAKSEFLAHMSHEIRSPMTAILGSADLLTDAGQTEAQQRDAVEVIRRNGSHLLAVINDILDLSKIEAGQMEVERIDCSLAELVNEVAAFTNAHAKEKSLHFEVTTSGPVPEVISTDPTRLRQILINVAGNAVKFTEKGRIQLDVGMVNSPDDAAPRLRFTISDTGIGMAAEQVGALFQPFVQADSSTTRRFGGTGLGLTISRRLAEALGGGVSVKSALDEGSTFTITIDPGPLGGVRFVDQLDAPLTADAESRAPSPGAVTALRGHVLLVEDSPDNQNILRAYLERAGVQVTVASNGKIACEIVARYTDDAGECPFDLVLMDIQMPVMDGYQATAALRRMGYDRPIAALTANAMVTDKERCVEAGCTEYITKPVKRAHLLAAVQRLLARSAEIKSAASSCVDDEDEILNEFRPSFVSSLPEQVSQLQASLGTGNVEDIGRLAHRLAGTTGMYRYDEVSDQASKVEELATQGAAIDAITEQVNALLALIRNVEGYDDASRANDRRHPRQHGPSSRRAA